MQKNKNKSEAAERINEFVQKHRKAIFICLGVIVLGLTGTVVTISLVDLFRTRAISGVEELLNRYIELGYEITDEDSADQVESLLADLNSFARGKSGYAGGRAWSIIASIHADREQWPEAEEAWRNAARVASKTYLAPIALFNAAVACEEQGNNDKAIELYSMSVSHPMDFPGAPHAQFSIGRLNEANNNTSAALDAYYMVLARWPAITVWVNLAYSRIIALESEAL